MFAWFWINGKNQIIFQDVIHFSNYNVTYKCVSNLDNVFTKFMLGGMLHVWKADVCKKNLNTQDTSAMHHKIWI